MVLQSQFRLVNHYIVCQSKVKYSPLNFLFYTIIWNKCSPSKTCLTISRQLIALMSGLQK